MLLLVGLGNPNLNNSNNRHNVGFLVIDAINEKFKLSKQKPKFKGLLTTGKIEEQKVFAIKPLTFMNSSGICVKELIEYFRIDAKNVFVFHDDMDISIGKIKVIDKINICKSFLIISLKLFWVKNPPADITESAKLNPSKNLTPENIIKKNTKEDKIK